MSVDTNHNDHNDHNDHSHRVDIDESKPLIYDEETGSFYVYGQPFTFTYFDKLQVKLLLDSGWSVSYLHNILKDTPLSHHKDTRLYNHRVQLQEKLEEQERDRAEAARIAYLNSPEYRAKQKASHEAFVAKSRAYANSRGRTALSTSSSSSIPSNVTALSW